jgi:hypothetical protein
MKAALMLFLISSAFSLGAEKSAGLLLGGSGGAENADERRAEAMGKQLDQFETMSGRVYRDVQITKISDGGISFSHADGAARLRFDDLSPAQRSYFGIKVEDAAAIYAREMKARAAYEREVEQRERERRELAGKEAAERAEAWRLAMEKAAEHRAATAAAQPAETIPSHPTIKRLDSGLRHSSRSSSYSRYYGGFGYGYPIRYNYSPGFRYGGGYCRPSFGTGINFIVR